MFATAAPRQEVTTHKDVQALSFQLLLIARQIARESPAEAHIRFGLEPEEVKMLVNADVDRLQSLSAQGKATFRPMFTSRDFLALAA